MPARTFAAPLYALAIGLSTGALAQSPAPALSGISIEDARRIAAEQGVVKFEEVERDDKVWEVEGRDAQGREIEVDIDIATGSVVKIDRK